MPLDSASLCAMTAHHIPAVPPLRGPVPLSHLFLSCLVRKGDIAVDATCGNGNDTLLLAGLVGDDGHVWGFDIQQRAISETGRRLTEVQLSGRVTLLLSGHEELARHIDTAVQVVLFNLGYLPGGDRTIITCPDTTIKALDQSIKLLAAGGMVLVTIYPGHSGGAKEQAAVEEWAAGLKPAFFHGWRMGQTNVSPDAPYLLLVQKAT